MRRTGLDNLWLFKAYRDKSETVVMPPELSTNKTSPTDEKVQINLLHCYERKFVNLPDHLQLLQLCSNVGITKTVEKGQYVTTLDGADLRNWEYTSLRDNSPSKVKGWICGNTKIGPVSEVAVNHHQGSYGIEIMKQSSFDDGICSWMMIVN